MTKLKPILHISRPADYGKVVSIHLPLAFVMAAIPEVRRGQVWRLLTPVFIHFGIIHLLFNMLVLFFFGPAVEERMGARSFGLFYFTCGIGGALFSLAISLFTPVAPFVGASAAVLGVALAFAMNWPDAPVYIFPLPVPIKVKWLVGFLIVVNLWAGIVGADTGVAYLAHLGGLLFGKQIGAHRYLC